MYNSFVALCNKCKDGQIVRRSKRRTVAPSASKIGLTLVKWRLCYWFQVTVFQVFSFSSSFARLYTSLRRIIRPHAVNAFVLRWRRINAYSASPRIMRVMRVFRYRDEGRDASTDTLKLFPLVRPGRIQGRIQGLWGAGHRFGRSN